MSWLIKMITIILSFFYIYQIVQASNQHPFRLGYQPPANSTFLSQQTSHQQQANITFLSEQISTIHQPPAKRTGCKSTHLRLHRTCCLYAAASYLNQ
jgi:hypothetical protein